MHPRRIGSVFALLIALALAACGAPATVAPTAAPTTAATAAPTAAPTAEPTAEPTAAATEAPAATAEAADGQTITDAAGRSVTVSGTPEKIVSLAPSATEILFALGLGPKVLAVDDFSDYPAEAASLPKVGGMSGTYNTEQIVALEPDLVLAAGITPPETISTLEELNIPVVVVGPAQTTIESISSDITLVGQITGQSAEATQVTDAMQAKLESLTTTLAGATTAPRVFWELDATDPAKPYTVGPGNFVNDLITLAGGTNIFASADSPYPQVSAEQIVAADPEVILLPDAAYGVTVESVGQRPGWEGIAAVTSGQVYPIDDNLVSRPGPRIIDGLEAVAKLIHPELFQ